jgi:hypothetical protein
MSPVDASQDVVNRSIAYAHLSGQFSAADASCCVTAPYLDHLSNSQLCTGVPLPECASLLHRHIGAVVTVGSKEQMFRTDTWAVVTLVEHPKAMSNRTVMDLPTNDVRAEGRSIARTAQLPVSTTATRCDPYPAWAKFGAMGRNRSVLVDLGPEALAERFSAVGINTSRHRSVSFGVSCPRLLAQRGGTSRRNFTMPDQIGRVA